MKGPSFCVIVIAIFFVTTNGQCPTNFGNNILSSCEGLRKQGSAVYVDFYKINRTCTCIVTPSFNGLLLVISRKVSNPFCNAEISVNSTIIFGCPINELESQTLNLKINEIVDVRAVNKSPFTQGTFYHCLGFQQNGGLNGNLSVICGPQSETTTTFEPSTAIIKSSLESTSVAITDKSTDVTVLSSNTSFDSLSMNSTKDDPDMLYIIAGSAAGGAIILVGMVILILMLTKRSSSGENKKGSSERGMSNTNEAFDSNAGLPDNPLYLSSQPMDELGYSSDQEKQLGLPPTESKSKKKINPDYDVPPNNQPIYRGESSMPVYAVPKKSNEQTPEVSTGDVYAQVCKPNISTAQ